MLKEETNFKPTLSKPTEFGANFQKNTKKINNQIGVKLNETDSLLSEAEQSLKKKIFSLPKMEALVFSDPKLLAKYEEMSENGDEKYGYHWNETVQNILFNDYVLNSPKYLQKYKQAIPKEKKRRDASGINQLKKAGEETMQHKADIQKPTKLAASGLKPPVAEEVEPITKVQFLVNEKDPENPDLFAYFPEEDGDNQGNKTAYSHVGQHSAASPQYAEESRSATPEEYAPLKAELEGLGYNLEVINDVAETTGAGSSGAFAPALGMQRRTIAEEDKNEKHIVYAPKVDETTGSASSGAYVGPAVWGSGDLMKTKGKAKVKTEPAVKGGTIIQESNYLIESKGFAKYFDALNEEVDVFLNGQNNGGEVGKSIISSEPAAPQVPTGLWDKVKMEGRKEVDDKIINKSNAFTSDMIKNWNDQDASIELDTIMTGSPDKVNLQTMEENKQIEEKSVSKAQQKFMGMVHAVQKGELPKSEVGGKVAKAADTMKEKDAEDFASTKHKDLPEKVDEEMSYDYRPPMIKTKDNFMDVRKAISPIPQGADFREENGSMHLYYDGQNIDAKKWAENASRKYMIPRHDTNNVNETEASMIADSPNSMSNKMTPTSQISPNGNVPTGMQSTGGGAMNESNIKLLEELDKELEAYSIHHKKLIKMSEDKKPASLILKDRLGDENKVNFKKDLQHSGTKEIIDIEKELQYKDQQTDVSEDPQKLGTDLEKNEIKATDAKSGEALKNVGDSTNFKGDEIPKRNMTTKEQEEVNMYRNGQHSLVYDNKPNEAFEKRMEADMGDDIYKMREKQLAFKGKAPQYNKDTQPTKDGIDKVQFDKEKSGWNEREGIKEGIVTGKFFNALGKKAIIDFNLNEVIEIKEAQSKLFEVSLEGLGNIYTQKVSVNESTVKAINEHKFFTDGKKVFAMKNPVQKLNESGQVNQKPVINEQFEKMKHLTGYKPSTFTDTKGTKEKRGF